MNRTLRHIFCAALLASLYAVLATPTGAADKYPQRPIRLVAGFPPGGGVDTNARLLADPLGKALGQTIVVDNRPGAASRLATELVAKAAPDGYTLLLAPIDIAINSAIFKDLPYDTLRDFMPISLVSEQMNILVAHPSIAAKSFQDFVALARAQPGKLTYASPGTGGAIHLASELLLMSMNSKMLHISYKGTGPSLTAVLANEVTVYLSTFASALPYVKADRLRSFAVTGAKRAKPLPNVPTIAESGVPGYQYVTWYGLVSPAGVSPRIIEQLNTATVASLKIPEVQQRYELQGLDPIPSTSAHYAAYLKSEIEKWTKVVRTANVKLQ